MKINLIDFCNKKNVLIICSIVLFIIVISICIFFDKKQENEKDSFEEYDSTVNSIEEKNIEKIKKIYVHIIR